MFLIQEKRYRQITDLFFRIFRRRDKIDGFKVTKIDVPSQNVDIEKLLAELSRYIEGSGKTVRSYLADILLLMISIQIAIFAKRLVLFSIGVFNFLVPAFELLS